MYVGIDLGGTNIAAGVVDENGKILTQASVPTKAIRPNEEYAEDMVMIAKKVIADAGLKISDIKSIGVGAPGSIDSINGKVYDSDNIGMDDFALAEYIKNGTGLPVFLENDANAAAFGEYAINGNGAESFVFVTLGTGVGGGIVIDGKIFRGFNGTGAEIGHTCIEMDGEKCTCGRVGCWEAYASVTALIRQTRKAMEENPMSLMHELADKEGKVSGRTSFDAAKQGDEAAMKVVENYARYVGVGVANMINIFQPNKIVIGGGISKEGDYLLSRIKKYADNYDYNRSQEKVKIEMATLFNDAGIIGAAFAAKARV
ncbi:MAG: ROK family glucokinase [Eubacteriales bacterium]|nr:ROK family glucokinase [Eubacteriales bacterium]